MTRRIVSPSAAAIALALSTVIGSAPDAAAQSSPAGLWDASVVVNTAPAGAEPVPIDIPFRFEIVCAGTACTTPKGSFFNGDDKVTSTSGQLRERHAHAQLRRVRDEARGDAQGWPARRAVHTRHARRAVSVPGEALHRRRGRRAATSRRSPASGTFRWQELEGRVGLAADRPAVGRRGVGGDPAHRRRHRHADRHVSRRHVRPESLLGRAAASRRADAGRRRHARRRAEHATSRSPRCAPTRRAPRDCRSRAIRRASRASRIRPSRCASASPISTADRRRTPTRASRARSSS